MGGNIFSFFVYKNKNIYIFCIVIGLFLNYFVKILWGDFSYFFLNKSNGVLIKRSNVLKIVVVVFWFVLFVFGKEL